MNFNQLSELIRSIGGAYGDDIEILGYNIAYKTHVGPTQISWPFDYPKVDVDRYIFKAREETEVDIVPTLRVTQTHLASGVLLAEVLKYLGMANSTSEGRRLIKGKGIRVNKIVIDDENRKLTEGDMYSNAIDISKGKNGRAQIKIK